MDKEKLNTARCYAVPRITMIPLRLEGELLQGSATTTNESFGQVQEPISFDS